VSMVMKIPVLKKAEYNQYPSDLISSNLLRE
jgi:hypothetical protein